MSTYFKYKSIGIDSASEIEKTTIDHVLAPIVESYYYLPTRKQLNDPSEGTFDNQIQKQLTGFLQGVYALGERQSLSQPIYELASQISHSTDNSGVFSLSKDPVDELMWAHYANSHCGIVIEYDIDLLTRFSSKLHLHRFDVNYSSQPPELGLEKLNKNSRDAVKAMLGYKSPRWSYEKEFRILLENTNGQIPHDYRAVKSITFGINVPDEVRNDIFNHTKDKVKFYYEIIKDDNSYAFKRELLKPLKGAHPRGISGSLDFSYMLANISESRQIELIRDITNDIHKDPHFDELYHAEVSTIEKNKVVVLSKLKHDMGIVTSEEYSKDFYDI